jgi:hypothetical protein
MSRLTRPNGSERMTPPRGGWLRSRQSGITARGTHRTKSLVAKDNVRFHISMKENQQCKQRFIAARDRRKR